MIWHSYISPSKSLLFWRLTLEKLSIDDKISKRGFHLLSFCNLCLTAEESITHLFYNCRYANSVWKWLENKINFHVSCLEICWTVMDMIASPQCKALIIFVVINSIYCIWQSRNFSRFQDKLIPWKYACNTLKSWTKLTGDTTAGCANSSI